MIYNHFSMRLHNDDASNPWSIRARYGELESFVVGSVSNPKPVPKMQVEDIPGSNGVLDLSGVNGSVYFGAKTVVVVLSGEAGFSSMERVESAFAPYQGRVIDFTFDDIHDEPRYQVGRMSAEFDRYKNRVTLTFNNVAPMRYGAKRSLTCLTRTNYERYNNADSWTFNTSTYGTPPYRNDTPGFFCYSMYTPNLRTYKRIKAVGATPGAKMLLGVFNMIGGDVWFEDDDGNESRTFATVCTPASPTQEHPGEIRMCFRVDGSHYEWVSVNGVMDFLPTIRCQYVLSNYVPIDENGKIYNYDFASIVTQEFDSNISIKPLIASSEGFVIVDGIAEAVVQKNQPVPVNGITMPSFRADKSGIKTDSVFTWIPSDNTGDVTGKFFFLDYQEAEVF